MGLLRDFVIKDERTKKILGWAKELIIIGIFVYMALMVKAEWQAGYDHCKSQACIICNQVLNASNEPFTIGDMSIILP